VNEDLPEAKKDIKYYKGLYKQKAADRKRHLQDCSSNRKLKRAADRESLLKNPTIFPLAPIPTEPIFPTAAVPKFALNTYVSIIPDTSLRGYLCNEIQGIVCALNR
jgi:hypothetical protein